MEVYKIRDINLENIVYSEPKGKNNKKVIIIGYKDPVKKKILPLIFQTAELYCGCSVEEVNSDRGYITHQLDVPIYAKTHKKTLEFKKFLTNLNNKIIEDSKMYSDKWFNHTNELRYKSLIRGSNNSDKEFENGIIKLKFIDNDQFKTYVFDENKNQVDPVNYLKSGSCYMKIMMEISGLWISNGNYFGIATRVYQVGITRDTNPMISTETYAFIEDSDDNNYEEFIADTELEPVKTNNLNLEQSSEQNLEQNLEQNSEQNLEQNSEQTSEQNLEQTSEQSNNLSISEIDTDDIPDIRNTEVKNKKIEEIKKIITELNVTEDDYPNIVTESYKQ